MDPSTFPRLAMKTISNNSIKRKEEEANGSAPAKRICLNNGFEKYHSPRNSIKAENLINFDPVSRWCKYLDGYIKLAHRNRKTILQYRSKVSEKNQSLFGRLISVINSCKINNLSFTQIDSIISTQSQRNSLNIPSFEACIENIYSEFSSNNLSFKVRIKSHTPPELLHRSVNEENSKLSSNSRLKNRIPPPENESLLITFFRFPFPLEKIQLNKTTVNITADWTLNYFKNPIKIITNNEQIHEFNYCINNPLNVKIFLFGKNQ